MPVSSVRVSIKASVKILMGSGPMQSVNANADLVLHLRNIYVSVNVKLQHSPYGNPNAYAGNGFTGI